MSIENQIQTIATQVAEVDAVKSQVEELKAAIANMSVTAQEVEAKDEGAELKAKFYNEVATGVDATLIKDGQVKSFNTQEQASAGTGIVKQVSKQILKRLRDDYVVAGLFGQETANSVDYEKRVQVGHSTTQWMGENVNLDGAPITGTPTFETVKMTHGKLAAFPVITSEAITDPFFDAEAFLKNDVSVEMSRGIAIGVLNGTGSNHQPKGFYKHFDKVEGAKPVEERAVDMYPVVEADIAEDAKLLEALRTLPYKMPARYVVGGKYVMNREMFERVSGLKDAIGRHYMHASEVAGVAGKLFGYDIVIDPMNTSVDFPVIFGHLADAFKLVNIPSSVTLLRNQFAIPGAVRFEFFTRIGTIVNDNQAVIALTPAVARKK